MALHWIRGNAVALAPFLVAFFLIGYGASMGPATAQTPEADGAWVEMACNEFHSWPTVPDPNDPDDADLLGEWLGEEVANTTVEGLDSDVIAVSTTNAYPSYGVICSFTYESIGLLPMLVEASRVLPLEGLTECNTTEGLTLELSCSELTVRFTPDPDPECLDPGEQEDVLLVYHVEQPALQQGFMAFRAELSITECGGVIEDFTPTPEGEEPASTPTPQPSATVAGAQATAVPTATRTPTRTAEELGVRDLPSTGSGGVGGLIGFGAPEEQGNGGKLLMTTGVLLALFGSVVLAVRQTQKRLHDSE